MNAGRFSMAIPERVGIPNDKPRWDWTCGFYPGSHPGECTGGAAETLEQAKADFGKAWAVLLSKRTEGRLSGMARSSGMDRAQIRHADARRADAVAEAIVR
jgi:hypothetical protein